jgi:hypothetical protein
MSRRRKNPEAALVNPVSLPPARPPDPPAVPGAFEEAWSRRKRQALEVVDRGIDLTQPLGMEADEYRARMVAAKLVLGVQKSALPFPKFGELEAKQGDRVIRLRWADGRLVKMPLHRSDQVDDEDDDDA